MFLTGLSAHRRAPNSIEIAACLLLARAALGYNAARCRMKGFILLALFFAAYLIWESSEIPRPPGVLVPEQPIQREIHSAQAREKNGYRITPVATFEIRARVVARRRYRLGRAADISPIDLVLGWGAMSDTAVLKQISFSQSGRAYTWMAREFPVPRRVIETHSANMHMIPANGQIERQLKSIRAGHMVRIKGFLVEVTTLEGWRWKTSLTREDTGGGACELVLVDAIEVS